uniref:Nicotinamidase-related amidase n=1 Tax=Candidatus Kentrum sp. SD TaxID=2126332 RepID=A0A451BJP6_9GAMM|nr:MAG: Nicotinamidase-related amidase [Candidatus Kentron sp. SD]VFK43856.1 MAG: Nicotinamidase-related amidase [Candidatus Kentron sp. SD]VFK78525.1 MAG: Nicotinamidase-related amidase [Candidatus Kentron sp. SD]
MMLIDEGSSCLLIVDAQEKLLPAIHDREALIDHCAWLMKVAEVVGVPLLVSEQYPKGLGPTAPSLRALAPKEAFVEKVHFSCVAAPECKARIDAMGRDQIVIAGIEAHVCVLQTALDLVEIGKEVFVVADAISSRARGNVDLAIGRMRDAGIVIVSREMVLFEWAHRADTVRFKHLSTNFLKLGDKS